MNKIVRFVLFAGMVLAAQVSFAQANWEEDPNWGKDANERKENVIKYTWLNDAMRDKAYDEAVTYLLEVIDKAPKGSERTYTNGIIIYKAKAEEAASPEQKKVMVDSMLIMYDYRLKYFGDNPETGPAPILSQRMKDYMAMMPEDMDGIQKYFDEALAASGSDPDANMIANYFKAFSDGYNNDMVEVDQLLTAYDNAMKAVGKGALDEDMEQTKKYIESLFLNSGVASCENLEKMYKDEVEANPQDAELLEKVVAMLQRGKCKGDFYLSVAEKFYAVKPSPDISLVLAVAYTEKGDNAKASKYLNEAIASETDPVKKANLSGSAAWMFINMNNGRAALDMAKQAVALNPEDGMARLAQVQASWMLMSSACSGFDRQAGSWLMYDMLSNLRKYFADDENRLKEIDAMMASHRSNFPMKEETFMRNISDGSSYTVNCGGVSGTTTVRSRTN